MRQFTLLFLFVNQFLFASFDINQNIINSYSHIINLEFEDASILLKNELSQNPSNGFVQLHYNYIDFLTIIITEDFDYFDSHEEFKKIRLNSINKIDDNSPYFLYSKAEIHLQWAFSRLKFKQYTKASYEILKAYNLLKKNKSRFPNFTLNNKGLGLIHALIGNMPQDLYWITNLLGLDASLFIDHSELNSVLADSSFAIYKTEVLFLLSFLQINLGKNEILCQSYLDRIGNDYMKNPLLNFAAARLSHSLGQNDVTLNILNNRSENSGSVKFYYLDYLHAMSYLYKLDFKNSRKKLEYFLINFKGLNYIKSAHHKLAWISFLQNDIKKTKKNLNNVILYGNAIIDEDRVSLNDAKNGLNSCNPLLLEARLLYDGGYYTSALSKLNEIISTNYFKSKINQIEYWYRLARVKSKLKNSNQLVLSYYKKVLDEGQVSSTYYAPMSALQIGLIYELENNYVQARTYFKICLSMSGFDYERGIHQKAKAGLFRISN